MTMAIVDNNNENEDQAQLSTNKSTITTSNDETTTATDTDNDISDNNGVFLTEEEQHLMKMVNTCEVSKLTIEQEQKGIQEILNALSEDEIQQMPDQNMPLRHLRAENGNVSKAINKLKATLVWRKEFGVDAIVRAFEDTTNTDNNNTIRSIIEKENETGKIHVRGYSNDGRAIMYMNPQYENTHNEMENNMKHLVYMLERSIQATRHKTNGKYEKIILIQNFQNYTIKNAPSMKISKYTLEILQNHYPERLYKSYMINTPFYFKIFWRMISPFIDPDTKQKVVMINNPIEQLQKHVGEINTSTTLEIYAGGTNPNLKPYDSKTFLYHTQFYQTYDE